MVEPKKPSPRKKDVAATTTGTAAAAAELSAASHKDEAKSRFNSALEEAKAGAAAPVAPRPAEQEDPEQ